MPQHSLPLQIGALIAAGISAIPVFAETHDVTVQNFSFTPNDLTIQVGDTVRWTNVQGFHDVTSDTFDWNSVTGGGWVFERTFNSVGEILYHCTVHSAPGLPRATNMNGRLNVVEPPPEFVFADGFEDLP